MKTQTDPSVLALSLVMTVCALVLGTFGWALVLRGGVIGWLLILAAACAAMVAYWEWQWR